LTNTADGGRVIHPHHSTSSAERERAFRADLYHNIAERERVYWAARAKAIEFDPVPLKVAAQPQPELKKPEPIRARRKPSLARMIKQTERSTGKSVTSATVDGVTLTFGEPAGGDDNNNNNSWDEVLEHAPHAKRPS
jgi:hypothetical protein